MQISRAMHSICLGLVLAAVATGASAREYIKGERPQTRAYSLAVVTEGGKTVWLAGQTAGTDENGSRSEMISTRKLDACLNCLKRR